MKSLLWIGVIVFALGIVSFLVPFPQRNKRTLSAGSLWVNVETTHTQTMPAAASVIMVVGGLSIAAAGGLLRTAKK
jgi:hypothetical protein